MIKFVSILVTLVLLNFTAPEVINHVRIDDVKVEFSEKAIGIESGQPIFPRITKVWVSNPTEEKYKLYFNEEEKELADEKIEISGLDPGTYTLMILASKNSKEEKRTVGFTIQ
ncbi:MAG: hypothetical protein AAGC64_10145 [Bacteroidota bacterium]